MGDVKDQEELKYQIRQQKRLEKQTIKDVKEYLKREHIKTLDWQIVPKIETKEKVITAKPIEVIEINLGRPSFEHRYERYEWHLKNGFDNENDVVWFKRKESYDKRRNVRNF